MPIAKLRTNTLDTLKPMADNSVNTYMRQAAGNESVLSFSRTGDNPVQWFQLINALDQQELQGWPFMAPVKVQMQKCDKCSKEFCSPINYRRHIRVHRRSLRVDKEWHKNRDLLAAFWDKLSPETTKEIMSFDDVNLEEVPGSSIIWSLASFVRKPSYGVFPLDYVKAGSLLLDIIQSRSDRLPISSRELFAILDDASEGTFLCAGMAESMQKFVFDGEAGKIGTEAKNLVACTSFLVEQKLVRYWVADMDAESLRCQQLLVEEEEAAQRKQAKLVERKRQKKLRQKEQKAKDQANGETAELVDTFLTPDRPSSSETTNLSESSESSSNFVDATEDYPFSFSLSIESTFFQELTDVEPQSEPSDTSPYPNIENQRAFASESKQSNASRWQVHKVERTRNGFHSSQEPLSKVPPRDQRLIQTVNGNKIWTRKPKPEHDIGGRFNTQAKKIASNCKTKPVEKAAKTHKPNCEPKSERDNKLTSDTQVERAKPNSEPKPERDNELSFDIQVEKAAKTHKPKPEHDNGETICTRVEKAAHKNCEVMIGSISVTLGNCNSQPQSELPMSENSCEEKHTEANDGVSRSKVNLWRPVSRHGTRGQSGTEEFTEDIVREIDEKAVLSDSCHSDDKASESWINPQEGPIQQEGFSTEAAKAFLSQRWKEATAGDHVTLVLTPETEPFDCQEAENAVVFEPTKTMKGKFKSNSEKGGKTKYIPKKKTVNKGK